MLARIKGVISYLLTTMYQKCQYGNHVCIILYLPFLVCTYNLLGLMHYVKSITLLYHVASSEAHEIQFIPYIVYTRLYHVACYKAQNVFTFYFSMQPVVRHINIVYTIYIVYTLLYHVACNEAHEMCLLSIFLCSLQRGT